MKVNSFSEVFRAVSQARAKQDGNGHGSGGQYSSQQKQSDSQKKDDPTQRESQAPVTDETVGKAVDDFQKDGQAQSNGLQASVTGRGPGLKVVLKDVNGAVVRQLSGEEFVKMRESRSTSGSPTRGKILDQKL